jgi:tRNA acetyltransferase TAN1
LLDDFNLIITTLRGHERQLCSEVYYLLTEELGAKNLKIEKTGIMGLITAKVSLDPLMVIENLREIIHENPYKVRYALRIIPIQNVIPTDLDEVRKISGILGIQIPKDSDFRVIIEKRYTSIHSKNFIEAAATEIERKVNLENPEYILLIEVLGPLTGVSLIKPDQILSVTKEKML